MQLPRIVGDPFHGRHCAHRRAGIAWFGGDLFYCSLAEAQQPVNVSVTPSRELTAPIYL
jgi:hypothetical protein